MNRYITVKQALQQYPDFRRIFDEFFEPDAEILGKLPGVALAQESDNTYRVDAFGETLLVSFSIDFNSKKNPLGRIDVRWLNFEKSGKKTAVLIRSVWFDDLGDFLTGKDGDYGTTDFIDPSSIVQFILESLAVLVEHISGSQQAGE